jgi:hypothetical protein
LLSPLLAFSSLPKLLVDCLVGSQCAHVRVAMAKLILRLASLQNGFGMCAASGVSFMLLLTVMVKSMLHQQMCAVSFLRRCLLRGCRYGTWVAAGVNVGRSRRFLLSHWRIFAR